MLLAPLNSGSLEGSVLGYSGRAGMANCAREGYVGVGDVVGDGVVDICMGVGFPLLPILLLLLLLLLLLRGV